MTPARGRNRTTKSARYRRPDDDISTKEAEQRNPHEEGGRMTTSARRRRPDDDIGPRKHTRGKHPVK